MSAIRLLELLDSVGPRVYALFTKLTGRVDAAEDLLQELFVKLLRSDGFTRAPNQDAYLIRSAIHLAFDWRRANRKSISLHESVTDPVQSTVSPIDNLIQAESVRAVLLALDSLSDHDRELICMRFLDEQPYETIANHYESSVHQIRSKCSKAIAHLRRVMGVEQVKS